MGGCVVLAGAARCPRCSLPPRWCTCDMLSPGETLAKVLLTVLAFLLDPWPTIVDSHAGLVWQTIRRLIDLNDAVDATSSPSRA